MNDDLDLGSLGQTDFYTIMPSATSLYQEADYSDPEDFPIHDGYEGISDLFRAVWHLQTEINNLKSNEVVIKIRLNDEASIPEYKHYGDSGMDIRCIENKRINPNETVRIKTGVAVQVPTGYEVQVRPRSGLASQGIVAELGTIDSCFRGDLEIIITNCSQIPFVFNKGDRIAQLVVAKVCKAIPEIVRKLDESDRNEKGYGSSGLK